MLLTIDTSEMEKAVVTLGTQRLTVCFQKGAGQKVLALIEEGLREKKATLAEIAEIRVKQGPGSFNGLRVGVTIANILGYFLKIPVNGRIITKRNFLLPRY